MTRESITTPRLTLKRTREEDTSLCFSIWLDETMGKYLSDPPKEKASEAYLNFAKDIDKQDDWYPYVAFLKDTTTFVGTCSLVPSKDNLTWDVGYTVHQDFWRQGYATEMITALMEFAKMHGAKFMTAHVAKENTASNILLNRLNFHVASTSTFKKSHTDIVYDKYVYERTL